MSSFRGRELEVDGKGKAITSISQLGNPCSGGREHRAEAELSYLEEEPPRLSAGG